MNSSAHHYLIKGIPHVTRRKDYAFYRLWVLDGTFIPVEIEFYED